MQWLLGLAHSKKASKELEVLGGVESDKSLSGLRFLSHKWVMRFLALVTLLVTLFIKYKIKFIKNNSLFYQYDSCLFRRSFFLALLPCDFPVSRSHIKIGHYTNVYQYIIRLGKYLFQMVKDCLVEFAINS